MARFIGIDYGEKRLGFAMSDSTGRIATPLETVAGIEKAIERLAEILSRENVGRIVLGLPRNMDGSLGPKAQEVLQFADLLRNRFPVPVDTWDERLTTVQAERYLKDAGLTRRGRMKRVDQVAAQILLQSYLDSRASSLAEMSDDDPDMTPPEIPGIPPR